MLFLEYMLVVCAAFAVIIILIYKSIDMALRDSEDERVNERANEMFAYMLKHAEVRVRQQLFIIDEMTK